LKTGRNTTVAVDEKGLFVNSHLNPFCNGVVISINAGVDVIFEMLGCRYQSWSFKESLRKVDSLKNIEIFFNM